MSEPKCVCNLHKTIATNPVCGKEYSGTSHWWCFNVLKDGSDCGHDRACHAQPLPAANTQETSNG